MNLFSWRQKPALTPGPAPANQTPPPAESSAATTPAIAPATAQAAPVRMSQALAQKGLRMTPQRLMIVAAIEGSDNHITADEVYGQVVQKYPNVNISTVYRTLDTLEEMRLVTRTDLGGGRVSYHPADKGRHHHLVCRGCGNVIDLDEAALNALRESLLAGYQFVADLRHLGIKGMCARCASGQNQPR